jgi:hypothetical protein
MNTILNAAVAAYFYALNTDADKKNVGGAIIAHRQRQTKPAVNQFLLLQDIPKRYFEHSH